MHPYRHEQTVYFNQYSNGWEANIFTLKKIKTWSVKCKIMSLNIIGITTLVDLEGDGKSIEKIGKMRLCCGLD